MSSTRPAPSGDHLAVLIDADNISSKTISGLMVEVAKYGTASVRRIYGDWTRPEMRSWSQCLLEHSIVPIQQFAYTSGKNATDGAMIIDAMDLLYTGRFASFCLVSSDSDFTRLASRIREQGIAVYGFGQRHNTHRALIAACNEFVYLDVLAGQDADASAVIEREPSTPQAIPTGPKVLTQKQATLPIRSHGVASHAPTARPLDWPAIDSLRQAIRNSPIYEDDYVNLAPLPQYLQRIAPDISFGNYGYLRLLDFVVASGICEIRMKPMPKGPNVALVRLKD